MIRPKTISIQAFSILFCISLFVACSSNSDVVSAKRKYRKGWFFNRAGDANNTAGTSKDTSINHNYTPSDNSQAQTNNTDITPKAEQKIDNKLKRQERRDSLKAVARAIKEDKKQSKLEARIKAKADKTPDPPDDIFMRLLILIVVLTALSILTVGLITPIAAWGITQNFMVMVGTVSTFIAYMVSVNTTLGINPPKDGVIQTRYNIGKPSFILSLWAVIPTVFLCAVIKTSLISHVWLVEIATIFSFVGGACLLISFCLALKTFFVNDRHPGKAWLALLVDALLIITVFLLL